MNISREADYRRETFLWGSLTWFSSKALGNARETTTGMCIIKPGQSNQRHTHPNCEEVLHVLKGKITHTLGDEEGSMGEGDTIVIPRNVLHHAINVGDGDAVLLISFSSGERKTIGE